ncbi:MAG: ELM1/GtrOC1 family putative glycosyltransferase, partial [Candidatus Sedimenticola sp. 6PFRAG1]
TGPGWVAEKLAESSVAWVTEDSVSMVYESLTAGVEVGLLSVPEKSESRVSRGLSCLVKDGLVTDFVGWKEHGFVKSADMQFSESDRCAEWIVSKL